MSYKESSKSQWSILARYKVVREKLLKWCSNTDIAYVYSMHRNCVSNVIRIYDENKTEEAEQTMSSGSQISLEDILRIFSFLMYQSRRPKRLRGIAPPKIEKVVKKEFKMLGYWYRRMHKHLRKRGLLSQDIKQWLIKGIYKREWYVIKKKRTKNREHVSLYNYDAISPFEYLHYDVKHILDHWALPYDIYALFEGNKELPLYQWTIIDAKTRWRFLAYSHEINATFWYYFLQFTIMYLRNQRIEHKIYVWFDGWTEFCSASDRKLEERNSQLKVLNCTAYQYDWPKDVRKNLVERSHKTDDEEFYVPRWYYISGRESFIKEARDRYMHYNYTRIHTGKCMDMTPYAKLEETWHRKLRGFEAFPVLILDECIADLMYHTKTIPLRTALCDEPSFTDYKSLVDFKVKLHILENKYAQNVLDPYQNITKTCLRLFIRYNTCIYFFLCSCIDDYFQSYRLSVGSDNAFFH